jgi:hypothetical protein
MAGTLVNIFSVLWTNWQLLYTHFTASLVHRNGALPLFKENPNIKNMKYEKEY